MTRTFRFDRRGAGRALEPGATPLEPGGWLEPRRAGGENYGANSNELLTSPLVTSDGLTLLSVFILMSYSMSS